MVTVPAGRKFCKITQNRPFLDKRAENQPKKIFVENSPIFCAFWSYLSNFLKNLSEINFKTIRIYTNFDVISREKVI
jgi:hypothetical protein